MVDVGQQLENLTFNDGGYPDVQFVVPDGAKGIYRELSEFVLYFWRRSYSNSASAGTVTMTSLNT